MRNLTLGLCLVLLSIVLAFPAAAVEVEAAPGALPTEVPIETESPDIILPSEGADGPQTVELLTSINTYLTYLFGFGVLYVCVTLGKLIYSFFNMFF